MLNIILQALFQSAQHLSERREGSGSGSVCPNEGFFTEESADPYPHQHVTDPQHWPHLKCPVPRVAVRY